RTPPFTTARPTASNPPHPTHIARMLHQYTTYIHSRVATSIAQDPGEFGATATRAPRCSHSTIHNCTTHRVQSASSYAHRPNVTPVHHVHTFTRSYINCARPRRVWGHRHPRTAPLALHHSTTAPPT